MSVAVNRYAFQHEINEQEIIICGTNNFGTGNKDQLSPWLLKRYVAPKWCLDKIIL